MSASTLTELEQFFQSKFIPSAVEMINNEVKVGLPSGRIVDVIGPEHRFMMSRLLINKFLDEYHTLIKGYLEHDFGSNYMIKLQIIKDIIQATRHLFFFKLSPVLQNQKLEPIIEKLDQCFFQYFTNERGDDVQ